MAPSASDSHLSPEFDNFLFATIGEDGKGLLLSVVSALARLNVDPWQEAAALSNLPKETATCRLMSLIAKLPVEQSGKLDAETIAARLIALLPQKRSAISFARIGRAGVETMWDPRIAMFLFFVISMLVALSFLMKHSTPSSADHALLAVSGGVSPRSSANRPTATLDAHKILK